GPAPTAPSQGSDPWPCATQKASMAAPPVNHRKRELFNMNPFLISAFQTRTSIAGFLSATAAIDGLARYEHAVLARALLALVVLALVVLALVVLALVVLALALVVSVVLHRSAQAD